MRFRMIALALAATMLLAGCGGAAQKPAGQYQQPQPTPLKTPAAAPKQWASPPEMKINPDKQYIATMKTSLGDIKIELFAKDAPLAVNNFVFLSREGFYEGVIFHRIIKDFMIQGGDPLGNGTGGPGYRFPDELPVKRSYEPGIVAMANAGPNTNGSQFFICNGASCKNLDMQPNYVQIGKVVDGMAVVQKISNVETTLGGDRAMSKPVNPPVIKSVVIEER